MRKVSKIVTGTPEIDRVQDHLMGVLNPALAVLSRLAEGPSVTPWIAPPLLNSWANLGVGDAGAAAYCRDAAGIVRVRGGVSGGASASVAFVLPAGYRPAYLAYFPIVQNGGIAFAYAVVEPSGNVSLFGSDVTTVALLSAISFRAEQ